MRMMMTDLTVKLDEAMGGVNVAITHASGWKLTEAQHDEHLATTRAAIIAFAREAVREIRCRWAVDREVLGDDPYECLQHPSNELPCDRCRTLTALDELKEKQ